MPRNEAKQQQTLVFVKLLPKGNRVLSQTENYAQWCWQVYKI